MKKNNKFRKYDKTGLFTIIGIIIPIMVFIISFYSLKEAYYVNNLIDFLKEESLISKLIALCAIPNLGIFMLVLNKELYKAARGVILATIIISVIMLISKYAL